MVGPGRPQIVLFGSSIVQYSFSDGGWGATLANIYSRTVCDPLSFPCRVARDVMLFRFLFLTNLSIRPLHL